MYRTQLIRGETKVLDLKAGRIHAVVSTEVRDRDGDIIRVAGWELDNFMRHPVLLASHNYVQLRSQIGEWESMEVKGKKLVGVAHYYVGEGNGESDWGFNLATKGMAAYSVGFIPDMGKAVELEGGKGFGGSYEFNGQELLETSQVTIPSNPQALQSLKNMGLHPVLSGMADEMLRDYPLPIIIEDKGAIPSHTTPKADEGEDWDAGAEVRQAEGAAELRRMHAWVDSDAEADNKGAYKLPHHRANGTLIWRGTAAAMAALLGARGGVDIPSGDRRGVYSHLVRHYDQYDKEPPEFKSIPQALRESMEGIRRLVDHEILLTIEEVCNATGS